MRMHQRGITFIGLLCILALVGAIGYAVIRLVPVYLNYMKISRTMEAAASEAKGSDGSADPGNIRRLLERHWAIEDPTALDVKDIQITKDDSGVQMHAAYDDAVPYLYNISLSAHFDKTVKVQ
jgi:Tfp pilus assembly protein PilE